MTREEAVKRLKERIDRQALLLDDEDMAALTELIPELRESEDERIRKKCIEIIKRVIPNGDSQSQESKEILDCIAYLEKQKEKEIPKWMPKFLDELRSKKHYFDWDETEPKSTYTNENYKYGTDQWWVFSKYNYTGAELEMSDDAARANMGGEWQMPSSAQCQELLDNTTQEGVTVNNIAGTLYTSTANGNTMFIPNGGLIEGTTVMYRGEVAQNMSRVISNGYVEVVLKFDGSYIDEMNGKRQNGNTIRAVINPS